jgi:hypothetical protein
MRKASFGMGSCALAALLIGSNAMATDRFRDCGSGDGDQDGRKSLRVVGLTDTGALVCFNERAPRRARTLGVVNGLSGGDTALVGIDFRVQDGLLYGVGNAGGVYTIDTTNGYATPVNRLSVALSGVSFGVDFNPAADRLRIVSDTGQNLRHNVNAGGVTLADATLNYTAGAAALGVNGAAYTNNDLDALTGTTLFDLDTTLDQIALQSPPNNGSLAVTGKLGVDAIGMSGFDIYSAVDGTVTQSNRAFAVINGDFYKVSVLTGKATKVGEFKQTIVDIAVPLNQ